MKVAKSREQRRIAQNEKRRKKKKKILRITGEKKI